ncbi:MAG: cell division inhibitor [Gammaproteobacteria bacterium]|jgi:septum site-determining protein MinC|nr:cell division inhibitor [Gammaproteobacteria bacterium]
MTTAIELEPLQLRASLFPLTILPLKDNNLNALERALEAKIKLAPQFFSGTPIVLDLHSYTLGTLPPFTDIKTLLGSKGLKLVGVATNNESYKNAALAQGLALMDPKQSAANAQNNKKTASSVETTTAQPPSKMILQPIRSGQQIYAENDLIILGAVSSGAEIIAGGNIHVYGKLSGRALAGTQQHSQARIFCREFDAELIAIAGVYQVKEDFDLGKLARGAMQIYLEDNHLKIVPL